MLDPEGGALKSPFVRQPAYSLLQERLERLQTVIANLVPEDKRYGVGLSIGSLEALQAMAASQSDAVTSGRAEHE
jgi:hypothetical protein